MKVKGFEHYELDPVEGTLYNTRTKRYVGYLNRDGYIVVGLSDGINNRKTIELHRLMAEHFVANPENKPTVHHINHNRHDNRVSNLRWATHDEQQDKEWLSNQKQSQISKPVRVFKEGFSQTYQSISEASHQLGLNLGNLSMVLNGRYKQTGGYNAEFV